MRRKEEERKYAARQLRALRVMSDFTQVEFAQMLGVSRDNYANYETGRVMPPDTVLRRAANVCKVNVGMFYDIDDSLAEADTRFQDTRLIGVRSLTALPSDEKTLLCLYRQLPFQARRTLVEELSALLESADE